MRGIRAVVGVSAVVALGVAAPAAMGWQGNLVVRKVNVGGPAGDTFAFSLTKDPNAYVDVWDPATREFTLTGAPSAAGPFTEGATQKTFDGLWAGQDVDFQHWVDYTVTEAAKPGYTTSAACSIDDADLWTTANPTTAQYGQWTSGTTTTQAGDTAVTTSVRWWSGMPSTTTCTFTNTKIPASGVAPVPPTGGGASSTTGGGASSTTGGGTTPGRSSHIVGPSSCLSRAHATVGVRGHGISSVGYSIGGRHVRTVRTRNGNGVYALVVRTRTLPRGATIVVARVTFRGGAHRTLRLRLSRCGVRGVRPEFTG